MRLPSNRIFDGATTLQQSGMVLKPTELEEPFENPMKCVRSRIAENAAGNKPNYPRGGGVDPPAEKYRSD